MSPLLHALIAPCAALWPLWSATAWAVAPGDVAPVGGGLGDAASTAATQGDEPQTVRVVRKAPVRSASESERDQAVLAAAPHRTGSDALAVLPGLWVTQHSGEGKAHQLFLRGFDASHGQDLELWVGDTPVNEVSHVHGQGYAELHFVPPELIQQLQLQPGSYDPRQGDFAVAGSVRYEIGLDRPQALASVSYGSFGSRRLFTVVRPRGFDDKTFAAFESYATRGFGPARAASRHSALVGFGAQLGDRTELRSLWTAYAGRYDSAGVLRRDQLERGVDAEGRALDAFSSYDPHQGGDSQRLSGSVALRHRPRGGGELRVAPYAVLRHSTLRANFTGFLLDRERGDRTEQRNDAWTFGVRAHYARPLPLTSARDRLELGVQLRHDRIEQAQSRLAALDGQPYAEDLRAKLAVSDLAGYLDLQLRPWQRVSLRGGLRADGLFYQVEELLAVGRPSRSAQGAVFSPRATVDLTLARGLHALLSYGEGFRSVQARSLANGQQAPYTRVRSTELGVRWDEGPLALRAAVYRSWLSADMLFEPGTTRIEAVPGTQRSGLSLDLEIKFGQGLRLASSLNCAQAVFRADGTDSAGAPLHRGALLPYAPQLLARTDLSLRRALGTVAGHSLVLHAGSALSALARRPLPYGEMGRDIFLWDARLELEYRALTLGLDASNLLDSRYYDAEFVYSSRFSRAQITTLVPARHVTMGPPRALYASLTVRI